MSAGQGELRKGVVKISWKPAIGGVTFATINPKLTLVSIILAVAGITILGGRLQVSNTSSTGMACSTIQLGVFPRQLEGNIVVVEIVTIGINSIVTNQAVLSISLKVGWHEFGFDLLVASHTDSLVKG
jgi:hypothetical protein